jgi:TPP-dependent pyruvate/acetoin dehydrogenase alpha subunit
MPGFCVDGMDPVSVKSALRHILEDPGNLPCVLEIDTYRHYHHAGCTPGSAFGYRSKTEEAEWQRKDPLTRFEASLRDCRVGESQIERLRQQAQTCVEAAAGARSDHADADGRRVRQRRSPSGPCAARQRRDVRRGRPAAQGSGGGDPGPAGSELGLDAQAPARRCRAHGSGPGSGDSRS